jgi:hypothetical protein
MNQEQFNELSGRIDGVARVLMTLICDLEVRERLNGPRFCQSLRSSAEARGSNPEHATSARVMVQIADQLDTSRENRSAAHQRAGHSDQH